MTKLQVRDLALKKGFQLELQTNGLLDLPPYVYEFAEYLSDRLPRQLVMKAMTGQFDDYEL